MEKAFPSTAKDIFSLGQSLVSHLKSIPDTRGQKEWTSENLTALRTFTSHGIKVKHYPPSSKSNQKDSFLWDYVAYRQGDGILIVAETEHNKGVGGLKLDFEKLFFAVAPIKLFMFRGNRDEANPESIVEGLRSHMSECCSRFMPGDLFILYCRTWRYAEGRSGDRAYFLQIPGKSQSLCGLSANRKFQICPSQ